MSSDNDPNKDNEEFEALDSDFDAEEAFDDADFVEEDWDAYDDGMEGESYDDESAQEGESSGKKSLLSNKMILGGAALVLIGGGAFMMMGGNDRVPDRAPFAEQEQTAEQDATPFGVEYGARQPLVMEDESDDVPREELSGFLHDTEALEQMEPRERLERHREVYGADDDDDWNGDVTAESDLPMPSAISRPSIFPDDEGGLLTPMPEPDVAQADDSQDALQDPSADIEESGRLPRAQDISRAETRDPAPEIRDTQPSVTPRRQQAQVQDVSSDDLRDLSNRLATIIDRLDGVENKLQALDGLQRSVTSLEGKVNALERRPAAAPAQEQRRSQPSSAPQQERRSADTEAAPAPASRPATSAQQQAEARWVLRSAQSGEAMVSRQGESDLFTVRVGETFGAIGRVTSIEVEGGRWVIQGTQGRITQ